MAATITKNRRKWPRQPVLLPAQYFIKNQSPKYQDCTVINLSRNGAAVLFPTFEFLRAKGEVFLEVIVPKSFQQLTLRGELKTRLRNSTGLIGGIQFVSPLREELFSRLT